MIVGIERQKKNNCRKASLMNNLTMGVWKLRIKGWYSSLKWLLKML